MRASELREQMEKAKTDGESFELRRILVELAARSIEGLKLYKPLPTAEAFHRRSRKRANCQGWQSSRQNSCYLR